MSVHNAHDIGRVAPSDVRFVADDEAFDFAQDVIAGDALLDECKKHDVWSSELGNECGHFV